MRVIKSGREKEWVVACPYCGADLVYKHDDICVVNKSMAEMRKIKDANRFFDAPVIQVHAVVCPECCRHVQVPEKATNRKPFLVDGGDWD